MAAIDFTLPSLSGAGGEGEERRQIKAYLVQLTDQLRYALNHLDGNNFAPPYRARLETVQSAASALWKAIEAGGAVNQEDLNAKYAALRGLIIQNADQVRETFSTSLSSTESSILSTVQKTYAAKTETDELQSQLESSVKQTAENLNMKFSQAHQYAAAVNGELQQFKEDFETNIRFSGEGITIGKADSPFTALFSNAELGFYQNGVKIAYLGNNKLYITQAETPDKLTLGTNAKGYCDIITDETGIHWKWREA